MSDTTGQWVLLGAAAAAVGTLLYTLFADADDDDARERRGGGKAAAAAASDTVNGVRASASGKVLITGGYLVLERANTGLVLSVDANFYASVIRLPAGLTVRCDADGAPLPQPLSLAPAGAQEVTIVVHSPQRTEHAAVYRLNTKTFALSHSRRKEENKFVESVLRYGLMLISKLIGAEAFSGLIGSGLFIYLRGDSQFYTSDRVSGARLNKKLDGKTGLGSSAALTSSLVASLFGFFGLLHATPAGAGKPAVAPAAAFATETAERKRNLLYAHNLAQFCHCAAQGKVGSGFDVSAAFFGSQTYRRFSPAVIDPLLRAADGALTADTLVAALAPRASLQLSAGLVGGGAAAAGAGAASGADVKHSGAPAWDYDVTPFALPPGLVLLLGDIKGGAKTPDMVRLVLEWRRKQQAAAAAAAAATAAAAGGAVGGAAAAGAGADADADLDSTAAAVAEATLWSALSRANDAVASLFGALERMATAQRALYEHERSQCEGLPAEQWANTLGTGEVGAKLWAVRSVFETRVRPALRRLGSVAGTAVEPAPSTRLLDDTLREAGVVCAAVPGAGGNDAIFAIVCGRAAAQRVQKRWAAWTAAHAADPIPADAAAAANADIKEVLVLPTEQSVSGGGAAITAVSASSVAALSGAARSDADAFAAAISELSI